MGRKFLLIATDQPRCDGLACNGGGDTGAPQIADNPIEIEHAIRTGPHGAKPSE